VTWVLDQSTRWSDCRWAALVPHPSAAHTGNIQSRALCWWALGRRPRWATLTTSWPLVTTAFSTGSPQSRVSSTAWVLTGPKPATSHTSAPTG
jgi:hypothetical protein